MNIAIACGGTGGHVFPGLAVAEELVSRGHAVTLLSTGRDVESLSLADWFGTAESIGLARYGRSGLLSKVFQVILSIGRSRRILKRLSPEVLLAMGGYASMGPVLAATSLDVPVVLHEGNAVAGRAMKFLASRAEVLACNFEKTIGFSQAAGAVDTGFPVRKALIEAAKRPHEGGDAFRILVIGGSQGAGFLNQIMPDIVKLLVEGGHILKVLHVAGEADKDAVERRYGDVRAEVEVYGFMQDMASLYAVADAAVSRSGASVCAELAAFGIPALLIPLPSAKDDHQTANAGHYTAGGGAEVISQQDMTAEKGRAFLESLISSTARCDRMRDGMFACARINAARDLADLVLKAGGRDHADI